MSTSILLAMFMQSLSPSAVDAAGPDAEIMEDCRIELSEDGSATFTPNYSAEGSDHADADEIAVPGEANGCWVVLEWCKNPGTGVPQCTCSGCTKIGCLSNCVSLIQKNC